MRETSEHFDSSIEREDSESTIRKPYLTLEERDALVREYNEKLLTPQERDAILKRVKVEFQADERPNNMVKERQGHTMGSVEGEKLTDLTQEIKTMLETLTGNP